MTQTASEIVTAGAFSMEIDFGNGAFDANARYLEISVRSVADGGSYVVLSPNQLVTSAPVAQFAISGNEGPQGPVGSQGSQGNPGSDGNDGAPGNDGAQGPQGNSGADGADGADGAAGAQGPQGNQGAAGTPGDSHWTLSGSNTYYNTGNVGFGTSNPAAPVHARTTGLRAIFGENTAPSGVTYGVWGQNSSSSGRGVYGFASAFSGTNYGVRGKTNSSSGYAGYFEGGRNYFQGNVGIGTNNPLFPLHVDSTTGYAIYGHTAASGFSGIWGLSSASTGNNVGVYGESFSTGGRGILGVATSLTGDTSGVFGLSDSTSGRGLYGLASSFTGSSIGVYGKSNSSTGYGAYFEGARNYFQGKVGIGTQSPTSQFHISVPAATDALRIQTDGITRIRVNANGGVALGGNSTVIGAGDVYIANRLGIGTPTPSFNLTVAGTAAKTGGGSWAVYSDQRLKKNIQSMTGSLDTISALRPVNFEYKASDHFSYTPGTQRGFIAQEVAKVIPQWVHTADDGYLYLDQAGYEALIVDAIQELRAEKDEEIKQIQAEQDRLRLDNTMLQARLNRLERMMALVVDN